LAALSSDVILAHGAATLAPLLQVTHTVPTVFVAVTDPVGAGLVDSLARPSGNATGFMNFEYGMRDAVEIERGIVAFARTSNGGLIVAAGGRTLLHRDLIIKLAAQYKLPSVYSNQSFVVAGGLISYGPDFVDQIRQAAGYVDRILKGEKPAELPVQAPTKYERAINLKFYLAHGWC
jgi:ABC-type uncharacterized transport system substrate-binding protein